LFALTSSCNNANDATTKTEAQPAEQQVATPDMASIKTEIQALEMAWSNADNARDANAVAAFYANDAVSMENNKPMVIGKAAILKNIEEYLAKKPKGATTTYEVMDVFGNENTVTEIGKTIRKDAAGNPTTTGKYMAVWEKRDGKYICVRDISNDDVKAKEQ
jgi:uncharacterized protein (TIGR02246 family)